MSAIGAIAAFSVAMESHGISPDVSDKVIDTALRLLIEREERAQAALADCHAPTLYWPEGLAS